jgi:hypothetical protein
MAKHEFANSVTIQKTISPPWLWVVFKGNLNLGSFKSFAEARQFVSNMSECA